MINNFQFQLMNKIQWKHRAKIILGSEKIKCRQFKHFDHYNNIKA
jgi:hypothetical protein